MADGVRVPNLEAREFYNHPMTRVGIAYRSIDRLLWNVLPTFRPLMYDGSLDLFCDECGKHISSFDKWICSYCDKENERTIIHSFLAACEKCHREPMSYSCPHCKAVNLLNASDDKKHPAVILHPDKPIVEISDDVKNERAHLEKKIALEREIEITKLNAMLEQLKASAGFKAEVSAQEQLEKDFSDHDAHIMGARMIAKARKTENARLYKDDPEFLKMKDESVDSWLRTKIGPIRSQRGEASK